MRMVVARVGLKSSGRPRWSIANWRSSRERARKPTEERRWLRVSGKESPIQARLVWPERLSKGGIGDYAASDVGHCGVGA